MSEPLSETVTETVTEAAFSARCYGTGTAGAEPVEVNVTANAELSFTAFGESHQVPLSEAQVSNRVGNTARFIGLPNGLRLETRDNNLIDSLLQQSNQTPGTNWLHRLERAALLVALSVIVLVALGFGTYQYGIPAAAKLTSPWVPDVMREQSSSLTLAWMDKRELEPTTLSLERREQLSALFHQVLDPVSSRGFNVVFRHSEEVGANAFAFPDGTLLFTDEIVELMNDQELLAIAAHEIGHVEEDHGMRSVISSSVVLLALTLITGDAEAFGELLVASPAVLAQMSYSRAMEREADLFAKQAMLQVGIPLQAFVTSMEKLADSHEHTLQEGEYQGEWSDYISTHPPTEQRIRLFQDH